MNHDKKARLQQGIRDAERRLDKQLQTMKESVYHALKPLRDSQGDMTVALTARSWISSSRASLLRSWQTGPILSSPMKLRIYPL